MKQNIIILLLLTFGLTACKQTKTETSLNINPAIKIEAEKHIQNSDDYNPSKIGTQSYDNILHHQILASYGISIGSRFLLMQKLLPY